GWPSIERASCKPRSEAGQAQSAYVHEHGKTVLPELADGDELDAEDELAVSRGKIGLALRAPGHDHPVSPGGLVGEVVKGSMDLRRVEAVPRFLFQLAAAGIQRRLVAVDPAPGQDQQSPFSGLLVLPDENHSAVRDRDDQSVRSTDPDVVRACDPVLELCGPLLYPEPGRIAGSGTADADVPA